MTSLDALLRELLAVAGPALDTDWRHLIETDIDNGEIAMAVHSMLEAMTAKGIAVPQALIDEVQQLVVAGPLADATQAQMLHEDLAGVKATAYS